MFSSVSVIFFLLYEIWYNGSIVIVEIPAWIIIYSMFLLDTLAPLLKASYRVFTSPSSYSQRYFPFLQSFDIRDLSFFWKKNKTYNFFFHFILHNETWENLSHSVGWIKQSRFASFRTGTGEIKLAWARRCVWMR